MLTNTGDGAGDPLDAINSAPARDRGNDKRPPRRWLAALLGVAIPGLGYLHMGLRRRALVTTLLVPGVPLLLMALGAHRGRLGGLFVIASIALCLIYAAIDVLRTRRVPPPVNGSRVWSIVRYGAFAGLLIAWQMFAADFWRVAAGSSCVRFMMFSGKSMAPSLLDGDRVVVDGCRTRIIGGDIALFQVPGKRRGLMLKRVAASEGQSVQVTRDAVLVDNHVFMKLAAPAADNQIFGPVTVPLDTVFVIGENLPASADSRHYGSIPTSSIRGRVTYILWSPLGGIGRMFGSVKLSR